MNAPLSSGSQRVRGWLFIIVGTALSIGMAALAVYLWTVISNEGAGGATWTSSHDFTVHTLELFGVVFVFGLVATAAGIYQLREGRTSRVSIVLLIILVAIMLYLGRTLMTVG
jgi:hypothetical protein